MNIDAADLFADKKHPNSLWVVLAFAKRRMVISLGDPHDQADAPNSVPTPLASLWNDRI